MTFGVRAPKQATFPTPRSGLPTFWIVVGIFDPSKVDAAGRIVLFCLVLQKAPNKPAAGSSCVVVPGSNEDGYQQASMRDEYLSVRSTVCSMIGFIWDGIGR